MPFRSEQQRRYLWANEPEIARRWTKEHGSKPVKSGAIQRRLSAQKQPDITKPPPKKIVERKIQDAIKRRLNS